MKNQRGIPIASCNPSWGGMESFGKTEIPIRLVKIPPRIPHPKAGLRFSFLNPIEAQCPVHLPHASGIAIPIIVTNPNSGSTNWLKKLNPQKLR